MARFQKFIKQKRVLAKDRKGRILSIPANFPIRFQLAKDSTSMFIYIYKYLLFLI